MQVGNYQNVSINGKLEAFQSYSERMEQKLQKGERLSAKEIQATYVMQFQFDISTSSKTNVGEQADVFTLADIGYTGKPIGELTQNEAKELVAEDGFFGISQTAQRIADFVINGAGDDESMLRAGRGGIVQGFEEAEGVWGGKLPDISYQTIEKAVAIIDEYMQGLDFSVVDTTA